MDQRDGWNLAMRGAGTVCVAASSFPLFVLLVGLATQSVAQTLEVAQMGGILLATAVVAVLVCMAVVASTRSGQATNGLGWIGVAVISVLGQAVLAVVIGMAWASLSRGSRLREPDRGLPRGRPRSPVQSRGE